MNEDKLQHDFHTEVMTAADVFLNLKKKNFFSKTRLLCSNFLINFDNHSKLQKEQEEEIFN